MAFSQSWMKVTSDNGKTSVDIPAGTIYRISSGNCSGTALVSGPVTVASPFPTVCPGNPQIDVLQTLVMQSIKVTTQKGTTTFTISALPSVTVVATYTCTIKIASDGTYTSSNCTAVK